MKQANPFAASNTCDWCERPAIKSTGTDGAFLPRFHLCALHAAAPKLLAALEELEKRLLWLSTYEKKPPEVVKDDFAYDRLLEFVKFEASKWAEIARDTIEEANK